MFRRKLKAVANHSQSRFCKLPCHQCCWCSLFELYGDSMKKTVLIIGVLALLAFSAEAEAARVKGYIKPSSGKYVQPHLRTNPDKVYINNYSSKGNTSPNTGKNGNVSFEQYQQKKLLPKK